MKMKNKKDISSKMKKDDDYEEHLTPEQLQLQKEQEELAAEKQRQKLEDQQLEQVDQAVAQAAYTAHQELHDLQDQVATHFQRELMETERNQYLNLMEGDIESAQRAEMKKMAIVKNAFTVMGELNKKERELIRFRLSQTKMIKCTFCGHQG